MMVSFVRVADLWLRDTLYMQNQHVKTLEEN